MTDSTMFLTERFVKSAARFFGSECRGHALTTYILQSHILLDSTNYGSTTGTGTCEHCHCENVLASSSMKIVPKKVISRRIKKLVWKAARSKYRYINNFQGSLVKKYKRNNGNKLVGTCGVCNKKNIKLLEKKVEEIEQEVIANDDEGRVKYKKKRKDKLAGLNASAVEKAKLSFGKVEKAVMHSGTCVVPIGIGSADTGVANNYPKHMNKNIGEGNKVTKYAPVKIRRNLKKCGRLQSMLALADAKKHTRVNQKPNFLVSLHSLFN